MTEISCKFGINNTTSPCLDTIQQDKINYIYMEYEIRDIVRATVQDRERIINASPSELISRKIPNQRGKWYGAFLLGGRLSTLKRK